MTTLEELDRRLAAVEHRLLAENLKQISRIGFVNPGVLAVAAGSVRLRMPRHGVIVKVTATVGTAPTGASLIVDVNKNGTTIFTTQANRPTIAAGSQDDLSSIPDVVPFAKEDVFTMDVDQVGSTVAGSNLVVQVRCQL